MISSKNDRYKKDIGRNILRLFRATMYEYENWN